jgi:hypothetical protein
MFAFVVFACVLRTCGRRPVIVGMTCATLIVILGAMVACGGGSGGGGGGGRGGGGGGTPPGTYMITINGQAGNFNHSSQGMQLVVH